MGELSSEVYSKFLFFLTNPSSFESIQPLITASPCSDSGSRAILGERDSGLNKVYDCETRTDNREFLDRSKQWKPLLLISHSSYFNPPSRLCLPSNPPSTSSGHQQASLSSTAVSLVEYLRFPPPHQLAPTSMPPTLSSSP